MNLTKKHSKRALTITGELTVESTLIVKGTLNVEGILKITADNRQERGLWPPQQQNAPN